MSVPTGYNPYAPPLDTAEPVDLSPVNEWRQVIRHFRQEVRAIAGMSFFLAVCTGIVSSIVSSNFQPELRIIVWLVMGYAAAFTFAVAGVQIAMKRMIGVRVLLFLSYPYLFLALLMIPRTFGFIIPVAVALGLTAAQCHRVLKSARRLKSAGIPLNMRPHELATEHFRNMLNGSGDQPPNALSSSQ